MILASDLKMRCGKLRRAFIRDVAKQRIAKLFALADSTYDRNEALAQRYVEIALKISKRCNVRLPRQLKRRVCKHCKGFLKPGANCRVRLRQNRGSHVSVTCLRCNRVMRFYIR